MRSSPLGRSGGMTSRQRVVAALNHEEPDRVPIDFGSNSNTGVNVVAYNRLKKYLDLKSPTYMRHTAMMIAAADMDEDFEVMKRMGGDILQLPRLFVDGNLTKDWKVWTLKDGSEAMVPGGFNPVERENGDLELVFGGVPTYRMPKGGYYFDRIYRPLAGIEDLRQFEQMAPSLRESGLFGMREDEARIVEGWARRAYEETDYALLGQPYVSLFHNVGLELFGYEKFFTLMAADPRLVHAWLGLLTEVWEKQLSVYLRTVGKYLSVMILADDYGTQRGPMISVKMFRELFKPYLTRICKLVHETSPHTKMLLHCCGSIVPLIPEFIEAGVDALNPVQTTAQDMDPAMLKREFGKDIVFWGGGVRCQTTLAHGTVQDVEREVREMLDIFMPGGGYVFCPDHDIQEDILPEKIVAVYDTARAHGGY